MSSITGFARRLLSVVWLCSLGCVEERDAANSDEVQDAAMMRDRSEVINLAQEGRPLPSSGCVEERAPWEPGSDELPGLDVEALKSLAIKPQTASLVWHDGSTTTIRFALTEPKLTVVRSSWDPNHQLLNVPYCRDHLQIDGTAVLQTDDGRFDERVLVGLAAYEAGGFTGRFFFDETTLRGSYVPAVSAGECARGTDIRYGMSSTQFQGSIQDHIETTSCAEAKVDSGLFERSVGSW